MTLWTVAHQAPCPWDSPGKNTGVGFHAFIQCIFLTHGSNLCLLQLLHCTRAPCPLYTKAQPALQCETKPPPPGQVPRGVGRGPTAPRHGWEQGPKHEEWGLRTRFQGSRVTPGKRGSGAPSPASATGSYTHQLQLGASCKKVRVNKRS